MVAAAAAARTRARAVIVFDQVAVIVATIPLQHQHQSTENTLSDDKSKNEVHKLRTTKPLNESTTTMRDGNLVSGACDDMSSSSISSSSSINTKKTTTRNENLRYEKRKRYSSDVATISWGKKRTNETDYSVVRGLRMVNLKNKQ